MPPVGLCNLGASCYLNASLQSLFAIPELDLALQQGGNDVANRLARVYTDWRTATEPIRPTLLTDIYYRNRQEDAHFFLLQLLDEVQQPDGIQHVAQSFMGVECRRLRCQHCGWQREAVRINFTCLQLELPSENAPFTTVEKLLRNHLSHITLLEQGLDSFQCPDIECTRARRHKDPPLHVPHVQSWPRVLFLQLKRWDNHNRLKLIDVECQETVEVDGTRYNLAAVVTHIGAGPNFGHYVAYCRRPGGWTRCNDRTVQEMSWREINNFHTLPGEKTYLLFYTKILPEDAIVIDSPETSPRPAAAAPIDLDPSDSDSDVLIQKDDPEPKTLSQELSDMVDAIQSDSNVGDRSQPAADRQKRAVSQDARPAKRLRGIYNYTKEERLLIGDTLRKSASLKDAMKALSDAMPKFTVKNVDSSSYLNRTTLRSWFNDHERLAKALALPDKISGETASSLSSTNNNDLAENSAPPDKIPPDSSSRRPPSKSCRSTLSEDDAAIVATALAEVNGAEDLAKILAVRLPGFSCEDRTAANYIPRSTLYNWIHRHQVKEWFGQDVVQVHTTWQEEHIRYFGVVAEKPQQRADMEPESSDVDVMWFTRGSWMFCPHCGRHQARTFTAEGSITDCKPGRPCKPCCDPDALDLQKPPEGQVPFGKLMGYVTPLPHNWLPWLRHMQGVALPLTTLLSEKEIQDLAIADIKVDYVTKRGGHAEVVSKQKKTVVRCIWRRQSLLDLRRGSLAQKAFEWLMDNNATYRRYVERHHALLAAGEPREFHTAALLLQTPGIEIAVRPWLYPLASFTDSDLQLRLHPLGWTSENAKPSVRAGFLRKILSRCTDYSRDYSLKALYYDLCMARTISAVVNVGIKQKVAPEIIASDMDIFEGYWHQQIRKMEDICRLEYERTGRLDKALPNVFFTIAPAEWKYLLPNGLLFADSLSHQQDLLTLHLYHSINNMLEAHLLRDGPSLKNVGVERVRQWSLRFEFQSRGTLHVHVVLWANLAEGWSSDDLNGRTDTKKTSSFLELLERLFRCRADVQCGDGSHVLLRYVAGYISKAPDALQFKCYQAAAHQDFSQWRQTYRLLAKKSPMEQELIMEFAGLSMVRHSFSGISLFAPIPGSKAKNSSRDMYASYQHHVCTPPNAFGHGSGLNFIQWLRRFRPSDDLKNKHKVTARNAAGPARGKDCGVAISFPFELLDIFIGAWAASCLPGMLESRLLPEDPPSQEHYPPYLEEERQRKGLLRAPAGCLHLKTVLCLDEFQKAGANPSTFAPDVGKLLTSIELELQFRGLGTDRINTFKARVHACTLLLLQIYSGAEDPELWSARRVPAAPERQWSAEQRQVLDYIEQGIRVADAAEIQASNRILHVTGGPGTGKTEVVIAATRRALEDGCRVLVAGPIGLLVAMYRKRLPADPNLTMETLHSAFQIVRQADEAYIPPGRLRNYDVIILDEVSQIDSPVWRKLQTALAELHPSPYIVLVGDFQQLQPIVGQPRLHQNLQEQILQGSVTCVRLRQHEAARSTDPAMLDFLNRARQSQPTRAELESFFRGRLWSTDLEEAVRSARTLERDGKDFTFLTVTNRGAAAINRARLQLQFPQAASELANNGGVPTDTEPVVLDPGMRLRLTYNVDKDRSFVNGQMGSIRLMLRRDIFVLASDQGTSILVHPICVKGQMFLPVAYGWATTIRRAQGATLGRVGLWFDRRVADRGYAYVGVSRAKLKADVFHLGQIRRTDWRAVGGENDPGEQSLPSVLSDSTGSDERPDSESESEEESGPHSSDFEGWD